MGVQGVRLCTGSQCNDFVSGTEREITRRRRDNRILSILDTLMCCYIVVSGNVKDGIVVVMYAAY